MCALLGVVRLAASRSLVACNLSLNSTVTVPAGSLVAVSGQPSLQFELVTTVTSTTAGTYQGVFQAVNTGPIPANAGTLTVIVTPVSGWTTVTNPLDAVLGRLQETDTELRIRRQDLLTSPGGGTTSAIRADVLLVPGVLQCGVFENVSSTYDSEGLPPHAIEVVVWDGAVPAADNTKIANAIWGAKPGGIQAYGTTTVTHTDDSGNVLNIGFSRATQIPIYLDVTIVKNSKFDTVGGPTAIKNLLANKGNLLVQGDDVVALVLQSALLEVNGGIAGVTDVSSFKLGLSASPTGTANLVIGRREIARFDTSRITVTVTP